MLANLGMEAPIDEGQYMGEKADNLIYEIYSKAELHYRSKLDDLSQRAHPVIKRVHDDESNDFKSILVPFTDGRKTIQVSTDIEESVATEAKSVMKSLEKQVVLAVIDQHWKEHLRSMDDLRSNVQHARHEQKDPLLIYKFESYELFKKMVSKVNAEVASFLMKCTILQTQTSRELLRLVNRRVRLKERPQKKELKTFHNRDLMPLEVWLDLE